MKGSNPSAASSPSTCGLYVHTPFCETKCGYCDFFSVPLRGRNTSLLVARVCQELRNRVPDCHHRVRTVFCGGGTPTLLPFPVLDELLSAIHEVVPVGVLDEFTVEANPATVDHEKARLLVQRGVNRVSMGAQSFFPSELLVLERLHNPDDIRRSVAILRNQGVAQINLDLIFAIPGQTPATWHESLLRAIDLDVDHIACYGLTFEPGTALTARKDQGLVVPCDEQLEAELYLLAIDTLEASGYHQYEISNFAKPGRESKHNLIYWRNQPYIGVGPSAAGCYSESRARLLPDGSRHRSPATEQMRSRSTLEPYTADSEISSLASIAASRRYKNVSDVSGYIRLMDAKGHAESESEDLDVDAVVLETILMQLRLNEGLSLPAFQQRTGLNARKVFGETLGRLENQGLLTVSGGAIALSRQGRLVANAVMTELACACDARLAEANESR